MHLSVYDVISLRRQAQESLEMGDDGELFAEEALGCFNEEETEAIEAEHGAPAEDFMVEVYATWEGGDPEAIVDTLASMLEDLDIELTYDEVEDEDEFESAEQWDDGVEIDDSEHFDEF